MSIERELLRRMFTNDLDIAAQFERIDHLPAAREALRSAAAKLDQISKLPTSQRPQNIIELEPAGTPAGTPPSGGSSSAA